MFKSIELQWCVRLFDLKSWFSISLNHLHLFEPLPDTTLLGILKEESCHEERLVWNVHKDVLLTYVREMYGVKHEYIKHIDRYGNSCLAVIWA